MNYFGGGYMDPSVYANAVVKNKSDFTLPIKKDRYGNWKLPGGENY